MTIEEALAQIPDKATAWQLQTRQRRTRFVCTLSWLEVYVSGGEYEEEIVGHGKTPQEAIMAAIGKLKIWTPKEQDQP